MTMKKTTINQLTQHLNEDLAQMTQASKKTTKSPAAPKRSTTVKPAWADVADMAISALDGDASAEKALFKFVDKYSSFNEDAANRVEDLFGAAQRFNSGDYDMPDEDDDEDSDGEEFELEMSEDDFWEALEELYGAAGIGGGQKGGGIDRDDVIKAIGQVNVLSTAGHYRSDIAAARRAAQDALRALVLAAGKSGDSDISAAADELIDVAEMNAYSDAKFWAKYPKGASNAAYNKFADETADLDKAVELAQLKFTKALGVRGFK